MNTDTKLENCHIRSNGTSPVRHTDIQVIGTKPVEIFGENYKKETSSKMRNLNSFVDYYSSIVTYSYSYSFL